MILHGLSGFYGNIAGGMSSTQRQAYIKMAIDYDNKALQELASAKVLRDASYERGYTDSQRQAIVDSAKAKEDLASEYRQQALKYRELAAK